MAGRNSVVNEMVQEVVMLPVPVGSIFSTIEKMCKISSEDDKLAMRRMLNLAYYDLASIQPWRSMQREIDVAYSSGDDDGKYFPSDMIGIYAATDDDNNQYYPVDRANILQDDARYRFYFNNPATSALFEGNGLYMTPGLKTITGITLTASSVGEYLQVGSEIGFYKIKTITTIDTPFRANAKVENVPYAVRPEGTSQVAIVDNQADFTAATVTFFYWVYPPPLWSDHHLIQLPGTRALELKTAMRYWGTYKGILDESDRLEAEYNSAIKELSGKEPMPITPGIARDALGRIAMFGRRR